MLNRRSLILGTGAILATPAIVRATSLMPVRSLTRWDADPIIQLDDLTFDGFNYINALGEKLCMNPVGRFSLSIRSSMIVKEEYKVGHDVYRLSTPTAIEAARLTGDWTEINRGPVRIGRLSDADSRQYSADLEASIGLKLTLTTPR